MADTNYNPQDEEFDLFGDGSDEEEDNLSSFDDVPDETDDNEEPEQADYNSSDDTPNDPNQEPADNYEEAKKEFEAEAENAAKWSLAEFAQKDEGYAMFLDTLVKAYDIDPNQNMQSIVMQLAQQGITGLQASAQRLITTPNAQADKSLRCLEAGFGENVNDPKYSATSITQPAFDITMATIKAYTTKKGIPCDIPYLAQMAGFKVGGSLESYNALLKDMLSLAIPMPKPEPKPEPKPTGAKLSFIKEYVDITCTYLDSLYTRCIFQNVEGIVVREGNTYKVAKAAIEGGYTITYPLESDIRFRCILDGITAYCGDTAKEASFSSTGGLHTDKNKGMLDAMQAVTSIPMPTVTEDGKEHLKLLADLNETTLSYPCFHLPFISGIYEAEGKIKRTTKYADMQDFVRLSVERVFISWYNNCRAHSDNDTAAYKLFNQTAGKIRDALMNVLIIEHADDATIEYLYRQVDGSLAPTEQKINSYCLAAYFNDIMASGREDKTELLGSSRLQWLNKAEVKPSSYLYSLKFVLDETAYTSEIIFGYQAIDKQASAGIVPSLSRILVGRSISGDDVTLSFDVTTAAEAPKLACFNISAGTRGGKGVMTLSILGTALVDNCSFIYLDGKPDMAALCWEIERKLGVKILAVDSIGATFEPGTPGNSKSLFPVSADNPDVKYENPRVTAAKARARQAGKEAYGFSASDAASISAAILPQKMVLLSYMMSGYCMKLGNQAPKRIFSVLDEMNKQLDEVYSVIPFNASDFQSKVKGITLAYKEAYDKKDTAKCAELSAEYEKYYRLSRYVGLDPVVTKLDGAPPTKYAVNNATFKSPVPGGIVQVAKNSEKAILAQNQNLTFLTIGQQVKPLCGSRETSFWGTYFYNMGMSRSALFGNTEYHGNAEGSQYITDSPRYKASGKTEVYSGYFVKGTIDNEGNLTNDVAFKSYLTLNDNDYFSANPVYCKGGLGITDKNELTRVFGTPDAPREEIGFLGYINHIIKILEANGEQSVKDKMLTNLGRGYEIAEATLKRTGIMDALGYSTVEDWLYDISPESLPSPQALLKAVDEPDASLFTLAQKTNEREPMSMPLGESGEEAFFTNPEDNSAGQNVPPQPIQEGQPTQEGQPVQEGQPNASNNPSDAEAGNQTNTDEEAGQGAAEEEARRRAAEEEARRRAQAEAEARRRAAEEEARRRAANQNTPVPVEGGKETAETPYGRQNAGDSTQDASAYKLDEAYQAQIDMGTPSDNPFVVYKGKGRHLREAISKMLVKHLRRMAGGSDKGSLDMITSFKEDEGRIIINDMPFVPTLDPSLLYCVPTLMKKDVAQGRWAAFLNLDVLTKMKNLRSVNIKDTKIASGMWEDLGIRTYDTVKLKKKLKKCQEFIISGVDILKEDPSQGDSNKKGKKEPSENVKKVIDKSKVSNFANALGLALGLDGCSADNHPVLEALGKSKGMRAVKMGALIGTATWVGSLLFAAANPFLIIGGLFTAGAYIKNCKDEAKNKSK